ncbi:MAG: BlaI family transcriptional regulator [Gemmatimonadetes bacterium]|nr:BlaI family transcriptional regulator [Gemmatimonadota bacterium]
MSSTVMTDKPETPALSRRERQVMDILHRRTEATVAEIMAELPDPPTYSAVRSVLRILGEKDLIRYKEDGPRYVYYPTQDTETARDDVLAHVVRTYFAGSPEQAVTALLRMSDVDMKDSEIERLRETIKRARQSGR